MQTSARQTTRGAKVKNQTSTRGGRERPRTGQTEKKGAEISIGGGGVGVPPQFKQSVAGDRVFGGTVKEDKGWGGFKKTK